MMETGSAAETATEIDQSPTHAVRIPRHSLFLGDSVGFCMFFILVSIPGTTFWLVEITIFRELDGNR